MKNNSKNNGIASNVIWHLAEKWGCQIVAFVVTIIISRKLDPSVYGIVTISNAFISIFSAFIDGGLGNSLIQKKNSDEIDFSTVFYTNLFFCILIYSIIFVLAPYIAIYFNNSNLTSLLRISGTIIILSSLKNIQQAYVSKNMMFKKFFFSSLTGTIMSGVIGIYLAYNGYGAWSLVYSSITDIVVDIMFMWFTIGWKPRLLFSFDRLKFLFSYGWKVLVSTLIDRLYNKMYHLAIGKYYSSSDLAYYEKGYSITSKLSDNTNLVVSSVLFPAMSKYQEDKKELKKIAKDTLKINFYIMTPLLVGLMVVAEPLIKVVLTEKWILAAPYIRLFCLINILTPFDSVNVNIIKSTGFSNILLKQELIKKIVCVVVLAISIKYGAMIILISKLVSTIIGVIINSYPNKRIVNYGLAEQIFDVKDTVLLTTIMVMGIWFVPMIGMNDFVTLVVQIVLGAVIYIVASIVSKNKLFKYLFNYFFCKDKPSV